jgi:hypothetical protein
MSVFHTSNIYQTNKIINISSASCWSVIVCAYISNKESYRKTSMFKFGISSKFGILELEFREERKMLYKIKKYV